ncbi:hypothetical protein BJ742DRAFT_776596 [Cladochytrium replicatum]|nr:hypothetical protein BJ742DRAFT_776596 [Cladochytrium replicatum]
MDSASSRGLVDILEWWRMSGLHLKYTRVGMDVEVREDWCKCLTASMNFASRNGHLQVLEWWMRSGLRMRWDNLAMDHASGIEVLEWWRTSGLELSWTSFAIDVATLEVLEWWRTSGLELRWTSRAFDLASTSGLLERLEWWQESGLELRWTSRAMDNASENGHVAVLEWWRSSGLELKWTVRAMHRASAAGRIDVLEWWRTSGLEGICVGEPKLAFLVAAYQRRRRHVQAKLIYLLISMNEASERGIMDALELHVEGHLKKHTLSEQPWKYAAQRHAWRRSGQMMHFMLRCKWAANRAKSPKRFRLVDKKRIRLEVYPQRYGLCKRSRTSGHSPVGYNSGLDIKYKFLSMDVASFRGHIQVLDWWRSAEGVTKDSASANGKVEMLEWWKQSGLRMRWIWMAMDCASENGHVEVSCRSGGEQVG